MQERDCDSAPLRWAQETGPDVPIPARRLLVHLAMTCDVATGELCVAYNTLSRYFRLSVRWAIRNMEELELAGLIVKSKDTDGDKRVNLYILTGVQSAWAVTTPFAPYTRQGFYQLHQT